MTGPPAVLVTQFSATHCRQWEAGAEHMCAVNQTHSGMVKFSQHDNEYDKARDRIRRLAARAVVRQRRLRAPDVHYKNDEGHTRSHSGKWQRDIRNCTEPPTEETQLAELPIVDDS